MSDEETLERNKLLLEIMTHVYDEDERRNTLVDSKNSQMIILTGSMLTLQATLINKLFIDTILLNNQILVGFWCKFSLATILFVSTGLYFISMKKFIDAYTFKDNYKIAPAHDSIIDTLNHDCSESDVVEGMLCVYDESMLENDNIINKKVKMGCRGFLFLKIAGIFTLIFLFLCILVLFSYPIVL